MNAQTWLTISHLAIAIGIVFTAAGGLGTYYSGRFIEKQRQEIRILAANQRLLETMDWYIEFWGRLGNTSKKDIEVNIFEYFNNSYFERLSTFNVYSQPNYPNYKTWYEIINHQKAQFQISMKDILNTYVNFLDHKTINLIEKSIYSSKFFPPNALFEQAKFELPFNQRIKKDFKNHIKTVLELLKVINSDLTSKKFVIGKQ